MSLLPRTAGLGGKQHIRVIAPSRSLAIIDTHQMQRALELLQQSFIVSFASGVFERRHMDGPALATRIADIDDALRDPSVNIVMSAIGGFSCAELLPHLDYGAIAVANKLFCGFSDVTVLLNNITLRSNIKTLYGPHFSTFGHPIFAEEVKTGLLRALDACATYKLVPPKSWGDEHWYKHQVSRSRANSGPRCLLPGSAKGMALGGNVVSLVGCLPISGWPTATVLFVEIHQGFSYFDFLRWLGSILSAVKSKVVAVLVGKFPIGFDLSVDYERQLVDIVSKHCSGPLILDMDFGHNVPAFSFPIGGEVSVEADANRVDVVIDT